MLLIFIFIDNLRRIEQKILRGLIINILKLNIYDLIENWKLNIYVDYKLNN